MSKQYKLLQFSSVTCAPCRMAQQFINKQYEGEDIGYEWIDVNKLSKDPDGKYFPVLVKVNPRSVPTFVIAEEKLEGNEMNITLLDAWAGFNTGRIQQYVNEYHTPSAEEVGE